MKTAQLCIVLCLIFVFGRVTTKRESKGQLFNSGVLSSESNVVPFLSSTFPNRNFIQIPSDRNEDDDNENDYDEQIAASFKRLKYIFNKMKRIRNSLSRVIRLRKAAKKSRKPILSQKVNSYLHIYGLYQYRKLHRLIHTAKREMYYYIHVLPRNVIRRKYVRSRPVTRYRIRVRMQESVSVKTLNPGVSHQSLRVMKRKIPPSTVYTRKRVTSSNKAFRAVDQTVPHLKKAFEKDTSGENINSAGNFRNTVARDKMLSVVHVQKKPFDVRKKYLEKMQNEKNSTSQQKHKSRLNSVDILWKLGDDDDEVFVEDVISELNRTEMAEAFQNLLRSRPTENHRKWKIKPSNSNQEPRRYSNQSDRNVPGKINRDHSREFDIFNKKNKIEIKYPSGNEEEEDESEEIDRNDNEEVKFSGVSD